jgi:hypothetical protein
MLGSLQSKHDYCPLDHMPIISGGRVVKPVNEISGACGHVCKAIMLVASSIRHYQRDFSNLDLKTVFWKPIGQQIMGVLISHIRRQRVSPHGARRLIKDIDEYFQVKLAVFILF